MNSQFDTFRGRERATNPINSLQRQFISNKLIRLTIEWTNLLRGYDRLFKHRCIYSKWFINYLLTRYWCLCTSFTQFNSQLISLRYYINSSPCIISGWFDLVVLMKTTIPKIQQDVIKYLFWKVLVPIKYSIHRIKKVFYQ